MVTIAIFSALGCLPLDAPTGHTSAAPIVIFSDDDEEEGEEDGEEDGEEEGASIALVAIGDGSKPGSMSASSLKSSLRKTSKRRAVRDCTRIVLGPWKRRKSYTYRISTAGDGSSRKVGEENGGGESIPCRPRWSFVTRP